MLKAAEVEESLNRFNNTPEPRFLNHNFQDWLVLNQIAKRSKPVSDDVLLINLEQGIKEQSWVANYECLLLMLVAERGYLVSLDRLAIGLFNSMDQNARRSLKREVFLIRKRLEKDPLTKEIDLFAKRGLGYGLGVSDFNLTGIQTKIMFNLSGQYELSRGCTSQDLAEFVYRYGPDIGAHETPLKAHVYLLREKLKGTMLDLPFMRTRGLKGRYKLSERQEPVLL